MKQNETKCADGSKVKVYCAHTEMVLTDIIKGNPKNPNKHPDNQIALLGKVIKNQGWRAPITISKRSGMVVKGHGRLDAAKLIECEKCPVDYQEYDTEADEIADMLADNKLAELSEIDTVMELNNKQFLIDEDFDLEMAGFEIQSFDDEMDMPDDTEIDIDALDGMMKLTFKLTPDKYESIRGKLLEYDENIEAALMKVLNV